MKKEKEPKQKPDRIIHLADLFFKEFKLPVPFRSGIEDGVYRKTVISGIEKKYLNHLLKDLARKQDLEPEKTIGYVRYKIDSILATQLKNSLFLKFKKDHMELRSVI